MMTVQILTPNLRTEAAAEVRRLTASRIIAGDADESALAQLEGDGPWITPARRTHGRRPFLRHVLLIWRLPYEDTSGSVVESCLVPVAIELSALPARSRRRAWATAIFRDADAEMRAQIETASIAWRQAVERSLRSFMATRISRERAIAARAIDTGDRAFQPGLFDRRAERTRGLHAGAIAEADTTAADRLAGIEQRAAGTPGSPRLLLALLP